MISLFPSRTMRYLPVTPTPRWINLDNRMVKDTWTGTLVRLTCRDTWSERRCEQHAMKVVATLNRLYDA